MPRVGWNSKTFRKFDQDKANEYAAIANEVFAPIYPVIAGQILGRCGVTTGLCVDLGTGPANLSIALAKVTTLSFCSMDLSWHILRHARENIRREGFSGRIATVAGDAHRLPFRDGTASLVVSRGSLRFWRNRPAAFREIRRILGPGGKGYVGGGLGSSALAEEISREMIRRGADWQNKPRPDRRKRGMADLDAVMEKAGFKNYEIIRDDSGSWVYFEK